MAKIIIEIEDLPNGGVRYEPHGDLLILDGGTPAQLTWVALQDVIYMLEKIDILDDLKARPERHGCPYFIGQVFKTQGGTFYKVEQIDILTYPSADGLCAYFYVQAVNQNKPYDRKEYTVQIGA